MVVNARFFLCHDQKTMNEDAPTSALSCKAAATCLVSGFNTKDENTFVKDEVLENWLT